MHTKIKIEFSVSHVCKMEMEMCRCIGNSPTKENCSMLAIIDAQEQQSAYK